MSLQDRYQSNLKSLRFLTAPKWVGRRHFSQVVVLGRFTQGIFRRLISPDANGSGTNLPAPGRASRSPFRTGGPTRAHGYFTTVLEGPEGRGRRVGRKIVVLELRCFREGPSKRVRPCFSERRASYSLAQSTGFSRSNTELKMTDTAAAEQVSAPAPASPKKAKAATKKKTGSSAAKKATHPPTSKMVVNAITALKERGGSSVQAIKKYIASTYKTDAEKLAPFIKKYLKSAVAAGTLLQTKGKGASGSFKLAKASAEGAPVKKPRVKKTGEKKVKKAGATKKAAPKKKSSAPKAKKTAKTPTKPKVPKAKKTTAKKASTVKKSPKKAAAKKPAKK